MSIKKIQELTGFSYSTISRVLNGKAREFRISEKTAKKILDTAEKLHYRPNMLARSLRLRKTMNIGLIVPDIQNPFFGELSSRIEYLLRERGYSLTLCNSNEIPKNEIFYLKVLADRQADGILIAPVHTRQWDYLNTISKEKPIVLIDRRFYDTDLPWVTSDNTLAAEQLTTELIESGYHQIAYLGGTKGSYINSVRFHGYKKALAKHSQKLNKDIILFNGYSIESGRDMMGTLLKRYPETEAVFCVNNLVFLGAMQVVQEHERTSHSPIMMSAFDIAHYCHLSKRPLLSADQDLKKLAHSAVSLLMKHIHSQSGNKDHIVLPVAINRYRISD